MSAVASGLAAMMVRRLSLRLSSRKAAASGGEIVHRKGWSSASGGRREALSLMEAVKGMEEAALPARSRRVSLVSTGGLT
jgi:hypothetical protein